MANFYIAQIICGYCEMLLKVITQPDPDKVTHWPPIAACVNPRCSNHNKHYLLPRVELEEVASPYFPLNVSS